MKAPSPGAKMAKVAGGSGGRWPALRGAGWCARKAFASTSSANTMEAREEEDEDEEEPLPMMIWLLRSRWRTARREARAAEKGCCRRRPAWLPPPRLATRRAMCSHGVRLP